MASPTSRAASARAARATASKTNATDSHTRRVVAGSACSPAAWISSVAPSSSTAKTRSPGKSTLPH
eukprot:8059765-Lingulodinium_polyedra.AAC.1